MHKFIGHTPQESIDFAANHIVELARRTEKFTIALSGGSTPKAIYQRLASFYKDSIDWSKVYIFFSDERCVPPTSDESNYKMAMTYGISALGIPENQIFRMKGEIDPKLAADDYQKLIEKHVPNHQFDLIMLGMGDDGHTASLFPETDALKEQNRLVTSNWVPKLNTFRLTFTYLLINQAHHIDISIIGESKAAMVKDILTTKDKYPIQNINQQTALYILDEASASLIK